jgi:hypothetical protein
MWEMMSKVGNAALNFKMQKKEETHSNLEVFP